MNILTVYILSYNRSELLKKSIQTILNQSIIDSISLQIYDNNSSFNIDDIVDHFDNVSISVIRHSSNLGSTGNFKAAFFAPKQTDYFCIFHDDDLMHPNYCESAVKYLDSHPDISWVAAESHLFSSSPDLYQNRHKQSCSFQSYLPAELSKALILSNVDFTFCSVIYRSSSLSIIDSNTFDNLLSKYSIIMDRPLLFDIITTGSKCAITKSKMINSYIHLGQDSKTGPVQFDNIISLLDKYIHLAFLSSSCNYIDKLFFKLWISYNLIDGYQRTTNSFIDTLAFRQYNVQRLFGVSSIFHLYINCFCYRIVLFYKKIVRICKSLALVCS